MSFQTVALCDGSLMPSLGFGTWNIDVTEAAAAVEIAITAGYRHIDCASAYENEAQVGAGIAGGIAEAGISRSDLWITSKLWCSDWSSDPEDIVAACRSSINDLGVDYLDLFLIHWPLPFKGQWEPYPEGDPEAPSLENVYLGMAQCVKEGLVRRIGVSNFSERHLEAVLALPDVPKPVTNQIELHPLLPQSDLVAFCQGHGIAITAYSPLAGGQFRGLAMGLGVCPGDNQLLSSEIVAEIASQHQCSPAQVALAWGLRRGASVLAKTNHSGRMNENLQALQVASQLTETDMEQLAQLDMGNAGRTVEPEWSPWLTGR